MVMVTLLSSGLILAPLLINEILRTRMNESVQQAILLAQISNMYDFDGRRPRAAAQALPLIGFEIATAEAPEPMQSWLVMDPSPRKPVRVVNLADITQW